jgi:hypothetical protein
MLVADLTQPQTSDRRMESWGKEQFQPVGSWVEGDGRFCMDAFFLGSKCKDRRWE